jgi:hypothetical protein
MSKSTTLSPVQVAVRPADVIAQLPQDAVERIMSEVNKDDLVAIRVVEQQDQLTQAKSDAEKELNKLTASVTTLQTKLGTLGPKQVSSVSTKDAEKAAKALSDAGFGKFRVKATFGSTDEAKQEWTINITILDGKKTYSNDVVETTVSVPFTAEATSLLEQIREAQKEIGVLQQTLFRIKRQFADLPNLALRARAKLARVAIERSSTGRQLLEQIGTVRLLAA